MKKLIERKRRQPRKRKRQKINESVKISMETGLATTEDDYGYMYTDIAGYMYFKFNGEWLLQNRLTGEYEPQAIH